MTGNNNEVIELTPAEYFEQVKERKKSYYRRGFTKSI